MKKLKIIFLIIVKQTILQEYIDLCFMSFLCKHFPQIVRPISEKFINLNDSLKKKGGKEQKN